MALIKCVECEKKISTLADSCTHCGAPIRHSVNTEQEDSDREEKDRSGLLLKLFLLLAVLGLGYLLTKKHVDPMLMCLKDKVISKVDKATDDHSITGLISGEPEDSRDSVKPTTVFDTVRTDGTSEPDNQVSPNLVNEMLGNDEQPPKEISEPVSEPTAEPNPAPASDSSPERIPPPGPNQTPQPPQEPAPPQVSSPEPEQPVSNERETPEVLVPQTSGDPAQERMDKLLNKTKDLKVKIIAKLSMDKDDMLVVTVNRNWPLLSRDQKQESVETIHESWKELDGGAIEFRNIKGHVVASLNRASQLIHGRATFVIEDGK